MLAIGVGVNSISKTKMGRKTFHKGTLRPYLEAPKLGFAGSMHSFAFLLCYGLLICDCVHMALCMLGPRLGVHLLLQPCQVCDPLVPCNTLLVLKPFVNGVP